jgi:hypothetical protein
MSDEQSKPSQAEIDDARAKLEQLAVRAKNDPALMGQLENSPQQTLEAHGLPSGAAEELIASWEAQGKGDSDVEGYVHMCVNGGCPVTYWSDVVRCFPPGPIFTW